MAAVAALAQQFVEQFGAERAVAEAGRQLQVHQLLAPVRPRGDEAAAHRSGQGLGEAADLDHPLQPVEGGQPRRILQLEVGEDVVLDDQQVMGLGELEQAVRHHRREHRAGGVVERRVGDVQARPLAFEDAGQRLDIRPIGCVGHTDYLHAVRAQQGLEVEVAGIVEQHGVARFEEEAADQVDGLGAAVGQHDLLRADRHAVLGQAPRQLFAQRRVAVGAAVFQQARLRLAGDLPQRAADFRVRQPGLRQPATARFEGFFRGLQRLAGYP
ncbi:hypothetical protein D9M69_238200 [compost metagenome]